MSRKKPSTPAWKRWLSYLFEFHLESAPSAYNPYLYVSLKNGRYQLCTANAIYSFEDLYTNFYHAFEQTDLRSLPNREVLVLGLGLGSIPFMLERHFGERFNYTLVEIDENVIMLAEKYCLQHLDASATTIQADAFAYMMQNETQYGMICMDIFQDDVIPASFESSDFLRALKQGLSPGGTLLYNRLYRKQSDKIKTEAFFNDKFLPIFPRGHYYEKDGNWVLAAQASISSPSGH